MIEHRPAENSMVAMQLTTDEGAFICNIDKSDVTKMAARESARSLSFIMPFGSTRCSRGSTRSIGQR